MPSPSPGSSPAWGSSGVASALQPALQPPIQPGPRPLASGMCGSGSLKAGIPLNLSPPPPEQGECYLVLACGFRSEASACPTQMSGWQRVGGRIAGWRRGTQETSRGAQSNSAQLGTEMLFPRGCSAGLTSSSRRSLCAISVFCCLSVFISTLFLDTLL